MEITQGVSGEILDTPAFKQGFKKLEQTDASPLTAPGWYTAYVTPPFNPVDYQNIGVWPDHPNTQKYTKKPCTCGIPYHWYDEKDYIVTDDLAKKLDAANPPSQPTAPKYKLGTNYNQAECSYCQDTNGSPEMFAMVCNCDGTFGHHVGTHPHGYYNNGCTGFIHNGMKPVPPAADIPPQTVLDLAPGSIPEDWHRHVNPNGMIGGWVYKTAKVDSTAKVTKGAVVCGMALIHEYASIGGTAKVFKNSQVLPFSTVNDKAIVTGVVGSSSAISGTAQIHGVVGDNCNVSGKTVIAEGVTVTDGTTVAATPIELRTQKAKGVRALREHGFSVPENDFYMIERLKTKDELAQLVNRFIRPCPITPRHGFVDSRPVKTLAEAQEVVSETQKADPEAEIIAMPFIEACHSGVWTEGRLSIGTGNDGATAGKDSYVIPAQGVLKTEKAWKKLLTAAGITESPYLELLWTKSKVLSDDEENPIPEKRAVFKYQTDYVQLRNGPALPETIDFIPKQVTVTKVVKAEGDLLKWEQAVKEFGEGTVVYHPGGSLASHYAVHAYISGIPVLISREPKVGATLEPNTVTPEPDIKELRVGFLIGTKMRVTREQGSLVMLGGCHSVTKWLGRNDRLLGMAMGCTYRLLVTAGLGEFRHRKTYGSGDDESTATPNREHVYETTWNRTLHSSIRTKYLAALESFDKGDWRGSFGGPRWFVLSRWAGLIFNALVDGDVKAAIEATNKAVNSVHNGGWTFNKFISQSEMNSTAANPIYAILKIAPILYDAAQLTNVILAKKFDKNRKFDIPELDVDKYLEARGKAIKKKDEPGSPNTGKLCCTKNCCGNPECTECHPVGVPSCPCSEKGLSGGFEHIGPEVDMTSILGKTFSICENHKPNYETAGWVLTSSLSEPDPSPPEPLDEDCGCGDHDCPNCYPAGCSCDCKNCHDNGCSDCQDDDDHEGADIDE